MMPLHPTVAKVTDRIVARSQASRAAYLDLIARARDAGRQPRRPLVRQSRARVRGSGVGQGHFARRPRAQYRDHHGLQRHALGAPALWALPGADQALRPRSRRHRAGRRRRSGNVRRGDPGQGSMELSLFSRDNIAMGTAVGLSHGMFEAALLLGICDKIVPGLLIGCLAFRPPCRQSSCPPARCRPASPTRRSSASASSMPKARRPGRNCWKAKAPATILRAPAPSMALPNSNQMMMETMGLHMPGASFVPARHQAAARS